MRERLVTRAAALAAATLAGALLGAGVHAQGPTPGPAEKAGKAVDRAVDGVSDELAEVALATRVRIALLEDLKEAGLRVKVRVQGGRVELAGEVASAELRVAAEGAARRVNGVKAVSNLVIVSATSPPEVVASQGVARATRTLGDFLLEARVKLGLLDQLGRIGFDVEVEARDGAITLSGEVPDAARQSLAVEVARQTSGVSSVASRLTVPKR